MKKLTGTLDEIITYAERNSLGIICYGAGEMGSDALYDGRLAKLIRKFVDGNKEKWGGVIALNNCVVAIYSPDTLKYDINDNIVLITSTYVNQIVDAMIDLELSGATYAVYLDAVAEIKSESREFIKRRLIDQIRIEYESVLSHCELDRKPLIDISYEGGEKLGYTLNDYLIIPGIDITTHTLCNLKCKKCSQLRPLFKKPSVIPAERVLEDMRLFFDSIDECIRVTVGGEALLHPDISRILSWLQKESKVFSILLITNGIALPNEECMEILKDPKFYISVSDYGILEPVSRFVSKLENEKIRFGIRTDQEWIDCGEPVSHGRTEKELHDSYLRCNTALICKSIYDGKMYCCNRAVFIDALDECDYKSGRDYFNLSDYNRVDRRKKIWDMFTKTDVADACDYCDQGTYPIKKIEAGVQPDVEKSKYTLICRSELEQIRMTPKKWRE